MNSRLFRLAIKIYGCAWLLAGAGAVANAQAADRNIDRFFDAYADEWVQADPGLAVALRYFSGATQDALDRQLTPQTQAYRGARVRLAKQGLRKLATFDRRSMSDTQRVSAELMQWQLQRTVLAEPYLDYHFPLDQFRGVNVALVEALTLRHPLSAPRDAENYVARLGQVRLRMGEAVREARRLAAKKRLPPRFIIDATLDSMRKFVAMTPSDNPLAASFDTRMQSIAGLDAAQRHKLRDQAVVLVESEVYPIWREAIAMLESLRTRATDEAGLWRFPDGEAAYTEALRRFTTTDMTPEEIHGEGLRLVASIESRMDELLRSLGRAEGPVQERMEQLRADLGYPAPASDESRARIMLDVNGYLKDALERSAKLFDRLPKASVVAQPFPRFREAGAAANYNAAPLDNSRPAVFQFPLRPQNMTQLGLRTLVYHETVPGHHFQIALEQENAALPKFRRARAFGGISAYSEGWALYAEELAAESGWYDGDPQGLLGQLDDALFRARRLVVDTGLHAKRWTRQQAIDFGIEASEVERYVVNPGQACSYMIGKLKILELRKRAQQALGEKFSLRRFHAAVLGVGSAPLEILDREIDRFITSERAS